MLVHDQHMEKDFPTVDLRMYPIKNAEGQVVCVGCFAHNAARRLAHENQLHLQQQKLLNIAWQQSHEMRAPLANILGISQLISQDTEMQREEVLLYLSELNKAAAKLDAIMHLVVSQSSALSSHVGDHKLD
jgi:signal transduction histidine kinase